MNLENQRFDTVLPARARAELFINPIARPQSFSEGPRRAKDLPAPQAKKNGWGYRLSLTFVGLVFCCVVGIFATASQRPQVAYDPKKDATLQAMIARDERQQAIDNDIRARADGRLKRAEPADDAPGVVTMPYGDRVQVHYHGIVPNQEALPLENNTVGDAYQIGKDLFVWVRPDGYLGAGEWIDPAKP